MGELPAAAVQKGNVHPGMLRRSGALRFDKICSVGIKQLRIPINNVQSLDLCLMNEARK
jgi:hypothetical protein